MPQKKTVSSIPTPSTNLSEDATNPTYDDIIPPSTGVLTELFSNLLDMVVSRDGSVTRREDQLDQLCNLILLKLDSDKQGKIDSKKELSFHPCSSEKETARHIRNLFSSFIMVYPDIFISATDKEIRFDDHTIYTVVDELYQCTAFRGTYVPFLFLSKQTLEQYAGMFGEDYLGILEKMVSPLTALIMVVVVAIFMGEKT